MIGRAVAEARKDCPHFQALSVPPLTYLNKFRGSPSEDIGFVGLYLPRSLILGIPTLLLDMDPFEVRLQFISLLKKLNASVPFVPLQLADPERLMVQLPAVHPEDSRICAEVLRQLRRRLVGLCCRGMPKGVPSPTFAHLSG